MIALLNATVETISHGTLARGTVLFDKGKIAAVGKDIKIPEGCEVIDGTGKYLTPGQIDVHTHIGASEQGIPGLSFRGYGDDHKRRGSVQERKSVNYRQLKKMTAPFCGRRLIHRQRRILGKFRRFFVYSYSLSIS